MWMWSKLKNKRCKIKKMIRKNDKKKCKLIFFIICKNMQGLRLDSDIENKS